MIKTLLIALVFVALTGCASIQSAQHVEHVVSEHPLIGKISQIYVGGVILRKEDYHEVDALTILNDSNYSGYTIPRKVYNRIGIDEKTELKYYASIGVINHPFVDPHKALTISDEGVCVVTVFNIIVACRPVGFRREMVLSEVYDNFRQELLYNGRVGDKINISYREYSHNFARPAFFNDVEYDLSISSQINYRGALIDIIKADNNGITYRVIRNFQ